MKKIFFFSVFLLITTISFAQTSAKTVSPDTSKTYKPNPERIYHVGLSGEQISLLLQTSQAGVIPYLKGIKLPMDKLEDAQQVFNSIVNGVAYQYRQQYVADSLKAVKAPVKK